MGRMIDTYFRSKGKTVINLVDSAKKAKKLLLRSTFVVDSSSNDFKDLMTILIEVHNPTFLLDDLNDDALTRQLREMMPS